MTHINNTQRVLDSIVASLPGGWLDIGLELAVRLRPAVEQGLILQQVKEKFGGLRVYTYGGDTPDLSDLYERAENTCMECGAPGKMTTKRGWIGPRCEFHMGE